MDDDELTAERILQHRYNTDHQLQFLIKWEGEDEEYATWESYDEVTEKWSHLLQEFNLRSKHEIICIDDDDDDDDNNHNEDEDDDVVIIERNHINQSHRDKHQYYKQSDSAFHQELPKYGQAHHHSSDYRHEAYPLRHRQQSPRSSLRADGSPYINDMDVPSNASSSSSSSSSVTHRESRSSSSQYYESRHVPLSNHPLPSSQPLHTSVLSPAPTTTVAALAAPTSTHQKPPNPNVGSKPDSSHLQTTKPATSHSHQKPKPKPAANTAPHHGASTAVSVSPAPSSTNVQTTRSNTTSKTSVPRKQSVVKIEPPDEYATSNQTQTERNAAIFTTSVQTKTQPLPSTATNNRQNVNKPHNENRNVIKNTAKTPARQNAVSSAIEVTQKQSNSKNNAESGSTTSKQSTNSKTGATPNTKSVHDSNKKDEAEPETADKSQKESANTQQATIPAPKPPHIYVPDLQCDFDILCQTIDQEEKKRIDSVAQTVSTEIFSKNAANDDDDKNAEKQAQLTETTDESTSTTKEKSETSNENKNALKCSQPDPDSVIVDKQSDSNNVEKTQSVQKTAFAGTDPTSSDSILAKEIETECKELTDTVHAVGSKQETETSTDVEMEPSKEEKTQTTATNEELLQPTNVESLKDYVEEDTEVRIEDKCTSQIESTIEQKTGNSNLEPAENDDDDDVDMDANNAESEENHVCLAEPAAAEEEQQQTGPNKPDDDKQHKNDVAEDVRESETLTDAYKPPPQIVEEQEQQEEAEEVQHIDTDMNIHDRSNNGSKSTTQSSESDNESENDNRNTQLNENEHVHHHERINTDDAQPEDNDDSDRAQAPSIEIADSSQQKHVQPPDECISHHTHNQSHVSTSSTPVISLSLHQQASPTASHQFADHLPSLAHNPSMTRSTPPISPGPNHHTNNNNTTNNNAANLIIPHFQTQPVNQTKHSNNNSASIPPQHPPPPPIPPNQQPLFLHFQHQTPFAAPDINSIHPLYHIGTNPHIDSNQDENSEFHHSLHTDSTNSSQQTSHPNVPTNIFMPLINQTASLHRHHSAPAPINYTTNQNPSTSNNPPPHSHLHYHQQQHAQPRPQLVQLQPFRVPLPPNNNQQTPHHPVLLPPPAPATNINTPPNTGNIHSNGYNNIFAHQQHEDTNMMHTTNGNGNSHNHSNNNDDFHGNIPNNGGISNVYRENYSDSTPSQQLPQSSASNSVNSIAIMSNQGEYAQQNHQHEQIQITVDFQKIKKDGAPYACPFCQDVSFQDWAEWKQHWYKLHDQEYFKQSKTQNVNSKAVASKHKIKPPPPIAIPKSSDSAGCYNMIPSLSSLSPSKPTQFPPPPTIPGNLADSIPVPFQLKALPFAPDKKRKHQQMSQSVMDHIIEPDMKRRKMTHSVSLPSSTVPSPFLDHNGSISKALKQDEQFVNNNDMPLRSELTADSEADYVPVHHRHIVKKPKDKKLKRESHSKKRKRSKPKKGDINNHSSSPPVTESEKDKTSSSRKRKSRASKRSRLEDNIPGDVLQHQPQLNQLSFTSRVTRSNKRAKLTQFQPPLVSGIGTNSSPAASDPVSSTSSTSPTKGTHKQVCCKICHVNTTNNAGLSNHIRARHGMVRLADYRNMTAAQIKHKQNEMNYNDSKPVVGISSTHRSRNIKYKYKCTVCEDRDKYCAGHVGLSSHLRSHVKAGELSDHEQKRVYKDIMKRPIPIDQKMADGEHDVHSSSGSDDEDVDAAVSDREPNKEFQNEVIGEEDEEEDSSDDDDADMTRALKSNTKLFQMPKIELPTKQSENTPPFELSQKTKSQSPAKPVCNGDNNENKLPRNGETKNNSPPPLQMIEMTEKEQESKDTRPDPVNSYNSTNNHSNKSLFDADLSIPSLIPLSQSDIPSILSSSFPYKVKSIPFQTIQTSTTDDVDVTVSEDDHNHHHNTEDQATKHRDKRETAPNQSNDNDDDDINDMRIPKKNAEHTKQESSETNNLYPSNYINSQRPKQREFSPPDSPQITTTHSSASSATSGLRYNGNSNNHDNGNDAKTSSSKYRNGNHYINKERQKSHSRSSSSHSHNSPKSHYRGHSRNNDHSRYRNRNGHNDRSNNSKSRRTNNNGNRYHRNDYKSKASSSYYRNRGSQNILHPDNYRPRDDPYHVPALVSLHSPKHSSSSTRSKSSHHDRDQFRYIHNDASRTNYGHPDDGAYDVNNGTTPSSAMSATTIDDA